MRKAQKKDLMKKLATVARTKIKYLHDVDRWDYVEIARKCDVIPARITEIVQEYKVDIAEITIIKLITGGVITVSELIKNGGLTEAEIEYTGAMAIYEDAEVKAAMGKLKKAGRDIMELLQPALDEIDKEKS